MGSLLIPLLVIVFGTIIRLCRNKELYLYRTKPIDMKHIVAFDSYQLCSGRGHLVDEHFNSRKEANTRATELNRSRSDYRISWFGMSSDDERFRNYTE
jgi:hypothetical protein